MKFYDNPRARVSSLMYSFSSYLLILVLIYFLMDLYVFTTIIIIMYFLQNPEFINRYI